MTPELWQRLKPLLDAALDRAIEDRPAFIDEACGDDAELKENLLQLILAARDGTGTLPPSESTPGTIIGPYQLVHLIGEGGMGQVWLAEQKEPVQRRVALKLIKAGMDTREVVARFQSERQALALMDHPAIAKVFDAGSTLHGHPYFVMEYVAGMPITAYADKHKLTTRQRLELFVRVCEGVQHAHQKAIIHRDLKPSNILVSEVDGKPMPRIIDFGVAKATSQKLSPGTVFTRVGAVIGTLNYMSPEQAGSGGEDIDTRSDVYSLGVVLYELLVGALPHDFKWIAYDEVLRQLREEDAPKPSTKLHTLGTESATAAKNRSVDPVTLSRQLRGDADAITLKALEKDRGRRYSSPSDLAADIGRYLGNEPVSAHAPSAAYRARKYIHRHRLGVAVSGVGVLLLAGFAITQTIQLRRITEERDRATRERDRADRVTEFMTGMFKVSDPGEARGNRVTAREILDKASKDIDTGLKNDPELRAKMMSTMANTYSGLGLYSLAQPLLEHAVEAQRRTLGPENTETLRTMSDLAEVLREEGRIAEPEKLDRETLEIRRRVLGPEHPDTIASQYALALILADEGHYAEAEKLYRETLDIERRILGAEDPSTLNSMTHLASVLMFEWRHADAEELYREAFDIQRRVLGPEHPNTLKTMNSLATVLRMEGRNAEAEKLQRETMDIRRRILGPEHPNTLRSVSELVITLTQEDRYPEAERLQREVLDVERRVLGPEHPTTLSSASSLASILMYEGHYADAEKLVRETLDTQRRILGREHPSTLETLEFEAAILGREGRNGDAEKLFRDAIQTAGKADQPGVLAEAWYNFANATVYAGRHEEALTYLGEAIDHGFADADYMAQDDDLKSLRGDPRFAALVAKARHATPATTH